MDASSSRTIAALIFMSLSVIFAIISLSSGKTLPWTTVDADVDYDTGGFGIIKVQSEFSVGLIRSYSNFKYNGITEYEREYLDCKDGDEPGSCEYCVRSGKAGMTLMIALVVFQGLYLVAFAVNTVGKKMEKKVPEFLDTVLKMAFIPLLIVGVSFALISVSLWAAYCPDYFYDALIAGNDIPSFEQELGAGWSCAVISAIASLFAFIRAKDILNGSASSGHSDDMQMTTA